MTARRRKIARLWDPGGVAKAFEAALHLNPDLILSHCYLGYAYEALQNWARAGDSFVSFLVRVNSSDPKAAPLVSHATRQAGLTLARTITPRRAIPFLDQTLERTPDDIDARFHLGVAYPFGSCLHEEQRERESGHQSSLKPSSLTPALARRTTIAA